MSTHLHAAAFIVFFVLFVQIVCSSGQVIVEFLYWNPQADPRYCGSCPSWVALQRDFIRKNETMTRLLKEYDQQVVFQWIDITSAAGIDKKKTYNVTSPNSLVINGKTKIEGDFNETYVRETIATALVTGLPLNPTSKDLLPVMALAFTFGFLETFSPCLIALLSFILSYTVGKATRWKATVLQVMTFGVGFVVAALSMGLIISIGFLLLQPFNVILTGTVCIFALFFGFNLLGLFKLPWETKPQLQKLTRKYLSTFGGLILLGFVFYFLDPCVAPIFFAMVPIISPAALLIVLSVFGVGVILPFLFVGILAGSVSKLARATHTNKSKIRAISGLILITFTLYVIIFHLF